MAMAETTFLMPSLTSVAVSDDFNEVHPIHALGHSFSLGRFMTEPLNWEKWSAFTHNRYVEEAENLSRPGMVAQKKAFFEAHYKNRASKKLDQLPKQARPPLLEAKDSDFEPPNNGGISLDEDVPISRDVSCEFGLPLGLEDTDRGSDVGPQTPIDKPIDVRSINMEGKKSIDFEDSSLVSNAENLDGGKIGEEPLTPNHAGVKTLPDDDDDDNDVIDKEVDDTDMVIASPEEIIPIKNECLPKSRSQKANHSRNLHDLFASVHANGEDNDFGKNGVSCSIYKEKSSSRFSRNLKKFFPARVFVKLTYAIVKKMVGSRGDAKVKPPRGHSIANSSKVGAIHDHDVQENKRSTACLCRRVSQEGCLCAPCNLREVAIREGKSKRKKRPHN